MELQTGRIYRVQHSRKGCFLARIDSMDDEWVHGTVAKGEVRMMSADGNLRIGSPVTMRRSFTTFSSDWEIDDEQYSS